MLRLWAFKYPTYDSTMDNLAAVKDIHVVLPLSAARRAALADDDVTMNSATTAVMIPVEEMWGVLVEHDWGNPDVYVKLESRCPKFDLPRSGMVRMPDHESITVLLSTLQFSIPVYFPKEAASLLPPSPTTTQINDTSYKVDMRAVDALVMALRIAPRDLKLYIDVSKTMSNIQVFREDVDRIKLKQKEEANETMEKADEDQGDVVADLFPPHPSGALVCQVHACPFATTNPSTTAVYLDSADIKFLGTVSCGGKPPPDPPASAGDTSNTKYRTCLLYTSPSPRDS
eukprot:TRINITY_DN4513_c0_g5_i3.p1 TRINITY_DN4513_c0_g5~~TRINITY_DN4513_c0_g5_i3.p1  ORF type:complete len:286 (-),score=52.35 TRINITY_DN4513_c0_g5_i3:50-907(-)